MSSRNLSEAFWAGRHQEVLARTWDRPTASFAPEEAPFVAGSLALLGRLEEAVAFVSELANKKETSTSSLVGARFFAAVGLCHTGRYGEAARWVRKNASQARHPDPQVRFFVYQGIALLRYFTGELVPARRASQRALREAVAANFAYGRLLALDLRGHLLVQRGQVLAGLRILDQAVSLAHRLGSDAHAVSIEIAKLAYQNRHGRGECVEEELSRVTAASVDNLYAHRAAWLELAFHAGLVGDARRAREALEHASKQVLPDSDRRARIRFFTTFAFLSRLDRHLDEVQAALSNAKAAVGDDKVLFAELLLWDQILGAELFLPTLEQAEALYRETGAFVSRVLIAMLGGPALELAEVEESPFFGLVSSRQEATTRVASAVERGWLGLIPLILDLAPGRHLVVHGDALIVDDLGSIHFTDKLPGHGHQLLQALQSGERSKEELIREVWGLARYAPQLHDAVIHTAVARLRRALGRVGSWICTTSSGYELEEGVEIVLTSGQHPVDLAGPAREPVSPTANSDQALLDAIARGLSRVSDLADTLGVSQATVLRRLRALLADGQVVREGRGKSTRYRIGSD